LEAAGVADWVEYICWAGIPRRPRWELAHARARALVPSEIAVLLRNFRGSRSR
jgi:hypothetical protein